MSLTEQFNEFAKQKYALQAQAFLNAYWTSVENDKEKIWGWAEQFKELDLDNKAEGCNLDEFNAHRFLEKNNETKTVKELREDLKEIDLNFDKRIALLEYLLFRYKKSIKDFLSRPQGDNTKEIEKAQKMIDEVQDALNEAISKAEEAKVKAEEAARSAKQAEIAAQEATVLAEDALKAENEQRDALAEVQAQEDARNKKTEDLTQKSEDENLGLVARNRAKNELAQHLSEDSLPLRRAKITLEAATKKATKARLAADESRDKANAAKDEALRAKNEAEQAKARADAAVEETERKLKEAQDYLEEVKRNSGDGRGSIWWLERQLEEKKKYMPKSKGGVW